MSKFTGEIGRINNLQDMDFSMPENKREILNLFGTLIGAVLSLQQENQKLKDEINRLKGEKGKLDFTKSKNGAPNKPPKRYPVGNESRKQWTKSAKKSRIKVDRIEVVDVDPDLLPSDAVFKGYEEKLVQNIVITTDNVLYRLKKYYSSSEKKTIVAKPNVSVQNTEYGPETKALISSLFYENRVTENKIASFLNANGLFISEGTVSNILTDGLGGKMSEIKQNIFKAGLASSIYQQIDDTSMNMEGKKGYATIVCNERYSAFFINHRKNHKTIRSFLPEHLTDLFDVLVGDDAGQFKKLAKRYALCWVHEERHYKKMNPVFLRHHEELERVRGEIWDYYDKLKAYKENFTEEKKSELWDSFDVLFGQQTEYEALNERLRLTLNKKSELLSVLDYPEVPLHNNLSENGVREMVLKRKISGGVKSDKGRKAWENNMTILGTCKKLGVSFLSFMKSVFSKEDTIDLPSMIRQLVAST